MGSSNDIRVQRDSNPVVICSLGTYPMPNNKCYKDILTVPAVSVFPVINPADDEVTWKFTMDHSQMLTKDYASELQFKWIFQDQILSSILSNHSQTTNSTLVLSANAFRENVKYPFSVKTSNGGGFNPKTYSFNFVPISCRFILVNNVSADSVLLNYAN
jgi:hypothetical protein